MTTKEGWAFYAWEQLGAIQSALISRGSLEDRLTSVQNSRIAILRPDMLPERRREALEDIQGRLTRKPIAAMSEDEREQLAEDLFELWAECERVWHDA